MKVANLGERCKPAGDERRGRKPVTRRPRVARVAEVLLWFVVSVCFAARGASERPDQHSCATPSGPAGTLRTILFRRRGKDRAPGGAVGPDTPCASYSRFSSQLQREESITDQQRHCRERAERNGHRILPELEFSDEAVSGTKLHRDGLSAMLAAAEAGEFRVLYFYNLSRLARESVITMPVLKKLVYVDKVRVISVTEGVDSDADGWDVMATILSVQHERYVKDLSASVFRGQEGTVLAGLGVGDYCFGYQSVPVPGSERGRGVRARPRMSYAVDPETSAWVVRIFHWFVAEKRSLRWITRELNRLGAPKDHRSTTRFWHHSYLPRLLGNEKYVGVWSWGRKKNVRNPLTGQVRQEDRPQGEREKWRRYFPELRIVTDEMREGALARLDDNARKQESVRGEGGRLAGSRTGNAAAHPRHLLSGLIRCEACGAAFQVGGAGGKYMRCPNWAKGVCGCKTQLRRELAERLILEALGRRVLANPAWRDAVLAETLAAWRDQRRRQPAERERAEKALAEVERKIDRLVDSIERGAPSPEVHARLAERRGERAALLGRLSRLRRAGEQRLAEPTAEWVGTKLADLKSTLADGGAAAALALRDLVGAVTVREVRRREPGRHYLRGRFTVHSDPLLKGLGVPHTPGGGKAAAAGQERGEEVVLDFRELTPAEEIVDEVKALWDAGLTYREIAARVGWNRNVVAKAVALWHRQRGLAPPDGRGCRGRLARETLPQRLAEKAKELWDRGLLLREIAAELRCNRDTANRAVRHWFRTRGQAGPDGRTRRKTLPRKSLRAGRPTGPSPGGGDAA